MISSKACSTDSSGVARGPAEMYLRRNTSFSWFSGVRIIQLTALAIQPVNHTMRRVLMVLNKV